MCVHTAFRVFPVLMSVDLLISWLQFLGQSATVVLLSVPVFFGWKAGRCRSGLPVEKTFLRVQFSAFFNAVRLRRGFQSP